MIGGVVFVVYSAIVLTGWPSRDTVATLTNVAFPVSSLIYVPLALLTAYRSRGRLRAAWLAITVGFVAWAAGEVLWSYYKHVLDEVPFPSWADVAYLSYVPCVAVALLLFSSVRTWSDQSRLIIDGLIVTGSFFLISWLTVMRPIWRAGGNSRLELALTLAYPAGDVLIMTLGFLVLVRAPAGLRVTMSLLVAALACSALGNGFWAYIGDPGGYEVGGLADIFYGADIVLVVLALIAALHAHPGHDIADAPPGRLSLWLPLLPVAIAAAFVAGASHDAQMEAPVIVTGVLLVIGALLRQLMQGTDLFRREQKIRLLADRLNDELDGAAKYIESILPGDLTGPVQVRSRYLPSRAVGGDSFGYAWVDDDNLIVYLIDVSGHGVRPALLSVSVHNLLRSNSLTPGTLLAPDEVLAELNTRFSMKNQDGHYFTMWYGTYRRSTGVLRYANAGHPPPLALSADRTVSLLPAGDGPPLGMFADSEFASQTWHVDAGSRILLYSDGVLGDLTGMSDFVQMCTELAAGPQDWLDSLVRGLPVAPDGFYEDDCSLVQLTFPAEPSSPEAARMPTLPDPAEEIRAPA